MEFIQILSSSGSFLSAWPLKYMLQWNMAEYSRQSLLPIQNPNWMHIFVFIYRTVIRAIDISSIFFFLFFSFFFECIPSIKSILQWAERSRTWQLHTYIYIQKLFHSNCSAFNAIDFMLRIYYVYALSSFNGMNVTMVPWPFQFVFFLYFCSVRFIFFSSSSIFCSPFSIQFHWIGLECGNGIYIECLRVE